MNKRAIQKVNRVAFLILAGTIASLGFPPPGSRGDEPVATNQAAQSPVRLAVTGTQFTLNGQPTFLLGISYYGGLGAPERFVQQDLDDLRQHGFNWLRLWATWGMFDEDVSAMDAQGNAREPYITRLQQLIAHCDQRGIIVDVTLTRGPLSRSKQGRGVTSFEAHRNAVELLIHRLRSYGNWYLDLANERDVRDDRYVAPEELRQLRQLVRQLDPDRLVTASFGGHDLSRNDIREATEEIGVDFLAIHRPRHDDSPKQTQPMSRKYLDLMRDMQRMVPVHYQEPFRRGYGNWEPTRDDYLTDLRGALSGGAAGWCLHNGQQQHSDDHHPRRSFDLTQRRLFDQLDPVEMEVIARAKSIVDETAPK